MQKPGTPSCSSIGCPAACKTLANKPLGAARIGLRRLPHNSRAHHDDESMRLLLAAYVITKALGATITLDSNDARHVFAGGGTGRVAARARGTARAGCVERRVGDAHWRSATPTTSSSALRAPPVTNATRVAVCVPTLHGGYLRRRPRRVGRRVAWHRLGRAHFFFTPRRPCRADAADVTVLTGVARRLRRAKRTTRVARTLKPEPVYWGQNWVLNDCHQRAALKASASRAVDLDEVLGSGRTALCGPRPRSRRRARLAPQPSGRGRAARPVPRHRAAAVTALSAAAIARCLKPRRRAFPRARVVDRTSRVAPAHARRLPGPRPRDDAPAPPLRRPHDGCPRTPRARADVARREQRRHTRFPRLGCQVRLSCLGMVRLGPPSKAEVFELRRPPRLAGCAANATGRFTTVQIGMHRCLGC